MRREFLVIILLFVLVIENAESRDISQTISRLTNKLMGEQQSANHTQVPFAQKFIGLWPSYIHFNFVGNPKRTFLRNDVFMYDNNMFVTAWITELMLEANAIDITQFPIENLNLAIQSLLAFQDKNYDLPSTIYSFWPQTLQDGTYVSDPVNLFSLFEFFNMSTTGNYTQLHAFYIPADFDDSSVSLAIGASLMQQKEQFGSLASQWYERNYEGSGIYKYTNALKNYAYKPFANDENQNVIDPRTYYWISDYLNYVNDQSNESGSSNISLISTWIMDLEINRKSYYDLYSMPFNLNNVDGSVVANSLYAITRSVLSDPNSPDWFDDQIQKIYLDSSNLITWIIEKELLNYRPDLVLLYYMGNYNFYWFVSRTLYLLNSDSSLPFSVLETVREKFENALRTNATNILLSSVQTENGQYAYWDNFIGVNDTTSDGEPINHADDRLCSTAVAIDTLINVWSSNSNNCRFTWDSNTPSEVISIVSQAVDWLNSEVLSHNYRLENAFFSGSVKGNDLPFFFPINYAQYLNGTNVPSYHNKSDFRFMSDELIAGIAGFVPTNEYQTMVNETWFGQPTPVDWEGYNVSSNGTLIYWSAPALTYATAINALGKSLQTCSA